MLIKIIFFFFVFFHSILIAQIEDSISTNNVIDNESEPAIFLEDSLVGQSDYIIPYQANPVVDSLVELVDTLYSEDNALISHLNHRPFSYQSRFLSKNNFLRNDYRSAGDILKNFPFSFEKSYGFVGQPNNIYLYAEESRFATYLMDGIPISNAFLYSFDFNHIQSEDIDSIEVVPLPRGFLYGFNTNPSSVNFLSRDISSAEPYSRIKYYEGPFGEAFLDGIFNIYVYKNLNISLDVTNRKVDNSFKNTQFSIWQVKTRLRYDLLDDLSFFGNYYFSKSKTGINGGVNIERILEITPSINSLLFNETRAPVYFENNSLDFKQHHFGFKLLARPGEDIYTNLNFYYKFYLNEYYANDTLFQSKKTSKDKVLGASLDQRFKFDLLHFAVHTGYQKVIHHPSFTSTDSLDPGYFSDNPEIDYKVFFVSPILSLNLLDSIIVPSVYYKYSTTLLKDNSSEMEAQEKFRGFGMDLSLILWNHLNLYIGYSRFDDSYLIGEEISALELSIVYKDKRGSINTTFFNKKNSSINLKGIGINASYLLWKLLFEVRLANYFIEDDSKDKFKNIPKLNFTAGLYYKDILFNSNLDLKAGFLLHHYGKQIFTQSFSHSLLGLSNEVPPWWIVDFTLTAEIQKAAIVYFTWENLFDWNYYITPYYPMLKRNIRFGIAWEIFN